MTTSRLIRFDSIVLLFSVIDISMLKTAVSDCLAAAYFWSYLTTESGRACPNIHVSTHHSPYPERAYTIYLASIKSVVTSHLVFRLRQVHSAESSMCTQSRSMVSTLRFNIVGNIGAPVHSVFSDDQCEVDEEIRFSDDPMSTILGIPSSTSEPDEVV